MANLQELRSHMNSIRDTQKVTNAMYLISSTKMRRARQELDRTRPYFDALKSEIGRVIGAVGEIRSPYFAADGENGKVDGRAGCLLITAEKGLAGDYNQNVLKEALRQREEDPELRLFVVGEFGRRYLEERGIPYEKDFRYSDQQPTVQQAREICSALLPPFREGSLKCIRIVYTDLKNSMTQTAQSTQLLPLRRGSFSAPASGQSEGFEILPSAEELLRVAVPSCLVGFIYSALVDSYCSEQNARMMAMRSAGDNADRLLQQLTVEYNRVRQNTITQEIIEVSSGAKAQRMARREEEQA